MKVLLVQLPVPSFIPDSRPTNLPLAAGYLKAMAHKEGLLERVDIEIMNKDNADLKGEAGLVDTIVSKSPDLLGFSCYSWNIIRSLFIAGKVKAKLPNPKVVVGGPEVTTDNPIVLTDSSIDVMVFGEGEETFVELLKHFLDGKPRLHQIKGIAFRKDGELVLTPPREPILDLDEIPSPYQPNILDPREYEGIMAIETMRGCPYRCSYCYYHKCFPTIRTFSLERIQEELEKAKAMRIKLVDLRDPSFLSSPRAGGICQVIKELNTDKAIRFHAELRADLIDERLADLLDECNIKGVEVGLQSTNPAALASVNRETDLAGFLRGVGLLKERNFNVLVDIIIGLPCDTLQGVIETIGFLIDNQLASETVLNILQVLPNTTLRAKAGKLGIRFQSEPPYYVLETPTLSYQDIRSALELCEKYFPLGLKYVSFASEFPYMNTYTSGRYPHLTYDKMAQRKDASLEIERPITKVIIDLDANTQTAQKMNSLGGRLSGKIANCLTVWFKCSNPAAEVNLIEAFLRPISLANPYTVWNIVLETKVPFPLSLLGEIKSHIFYHNHLLDYYYCFRSEEPSFSRQATRLFLVLPFDENASDEEWLNDLNKGVLVFWATELSNDGDVEKKLDDLCKKVGIGLLIDFHPNSSPDFIIDTLKLLQAKNARGGKSIRFRNWVLQRLWNVKFQGRTEPFGVGEFILNFDEDLRVASTAFQEDELTLDMAEWILATRKSQEAMP